MSYDLRKTDGTRLVLLNNEIIDTETISGIGLVGRLSANYGETQSNNFIHLVENFASTEFPNPSLKGQICYKLTEEGDGSLYICVKDLSDDDYNPNDISENWKKMPLVIISNVNPSGTFVSGDMWYDTNEHAFKMFDKGLGYEGEWVTIGPDGYSKTKRFFGESTLGSGANETIASYSFKDEKPNSSYLFIAKVVVKGIQNKLDSKAFIAKFLLNTYLETSTKLKIEIVGTPDYETIGTSFSPDELELIPEINEENTSIDFKAKMGSYGIGKQTKWLVQVDMLKVSDNDSN